MKKFLVTLLMMLSVNCSAATIDEVRLSASTSYPVIHVGDEAVDRKINTTIIEEVSKFFTDVQRTAKANDFEIGDVRVGYRVGSNEAGNTVILSVVLIESSYFKGGAHPATDWRTMNFNTANGELMTLEYLTEVGDGFRTGELLCRLEAKLKEQCAREGLYLFDDALPLKELPQDFYWDENLHVHFVFQHYAIAPYAAGIIDVDIDD